MATTTNRPELLDPVSCAPVSLLACVKTLPSLELGRTKAGRVIYNVDGSCLCRLGEIAETMTIWELEVLLFEAGDCVSLTVSVELRLWQSM